VQTEGAIDGGCRGAERTEPRAASYFFYSAPRGWLLSRERDRNRMAETAKRP